MKAYKTREERNITRLAVISGCLAFATLVMVACLMGAYPGNVGTINNAYWSQTSPLATDVGQGYSTIGQGSVTLSGTQGLCLSSGGTATTSVPCKLVVLSYSSSTGASSNVGYLGTSSTLQTMGFGCLQPSGSPLYSATISIPASNLNQLWVSGGTPGKFSYMYFN